MITIHLSNRVLYSLLVIISLLLVGVSVVAYQSGLSPATAGHSADEVEVFFNDSGGTGRLLSDVMNEQNARINALRRFTEPLRIDLYDSDITTWVCKQQDLKELCGDADGCTIRVLYQNQNDGTDLVRTIEAHIYMEQQGLSRNNGAGIHGWTRQDGGDLNWIAGLSEGRYPVFDIWDVSIRNYIHDLCPGQTGDSQAFVENPYIFSFMTHPDWETTFLIYD